MVSKSLILVMIVAASAAVTFIVLGAIMLAEGRWDRTHTDEYLQLAGQISYVKGAAFLAGVIGIIGVVLFLLIAWARGDKKGTFAENYHSFMSEADQRLAAATTQFQLPS